MKRLRIIASLGALFVFGGICGFSIAARMIKNSLSEDYFVKQRMTEEKKRLKLTNEQLELAKPSYDELKADLSKVKGDTVTAITQAVIKQGVELAGVLTPEQLVEFKKLGEERRQRFEKTIKP